MTREQLLNLIKERPIEIGHWCGFDKLDDLQNDWLRNFLFRTDDQTLLAHRNSYKTTTLSLFFSLFLLLRPEDNIIYLPLKYTVSAGSFGTNYDSIELPE